VLATLGFSLALAAGEYALSIIAYLVVYEIVAGKGTLRLRLTAAMTGLAPALVYLALHVALGYGATGSAVYVDPVATPGKFVIAALLRIPALIASDVTLLPPEVLHVASAGAGLLGWFVLLALLAPLVVLLPGALGRYPERERRQLTAFALGGVASLVPLAGTLPSSRLLSVPSVGGSLVLAVLIADAARGVLSAERRRRATTWLRVAAGLSLALLHLLIAPLASLVGAIGWRDLHLRSRHTYLTAPIDDRGLEERTLVLVNAIEPMALSAPPFVRAEVGHPLPKRWRVLSITHRRQELRRVSDDTLELTVVSGGMLEDPVSQVFRALEHPLTRNQRVTLSDMTIEVVEIAEWGPKRVRYRFSRSLDDPSIVVLALERGVLRRVPPLRVGQKLEIAPG
jgi:hypothetical protein